VRVDSGGGRAAERADGRRSVAGARSLMDTKDDYGRRTEASSMLDICADSVVITSRHIAAATRPARLSQVETYDTD